jgi:hypothetical protein
MHAAVEEHAPPRVLDHEDRNGHPDAALRPFDEKRARSGQPTAGEREQPDRHGFTMARLGVARARMGVE